jgi:hypothetical protein
MSRYQRDWRALGLEKRALTRDWVLDKLLKNIERGESKGDINGVNRALEDRH